MTQPMVAIRPEADNKTVAVAKPTVTLMYFAFGSNLSSTQMHSRCHDSQAMGLGYLRGWTFIINERGYANVVLSVPTTTASPSSSTSNDGVYGVLYHLGSTSEKEQLDGYEGVPWAYEDLILPVEMLDKEGNSVGKVWALVYVDRQHTTPAEPKVEYVGRMNRGIEEAVRDWGLPEAYVSGVMRRFIPEE